MRKKVKVTITGEYIIDTFFDANWYNIKEEGKTKRQVLQEMLDKMKIDDDVLYVFERLSNVKMKFSE